MKIGQIKDLKTSFEFKTYSSGCTEDGNEYVVPKEKRLFILIVFGHQYDRQNVTRTDRLGPTCRSVAMLARSYSSP